MTILILDLIAFASWDSVILFFSSYCSKVRDCVTFEMHVGSSRNFSAENIVSCRIGTMDLHMYI